MQSNETGKFAIHRSKRDLFICTFAFACLSLAAIHPAGALPLKYAKDISQAPADDLDPNQKQASPATQADPAQTQPVAPGTKILPTQTNLSDLGVSKEALQIAKTLGVKRHFDHIFDLKAKLAFEDMPATERNLKRIEMLEHRQRIVEKIEEARIQIDFVLAEINDEENAYEDLRQKYEQTRDRKVSRANLMSFGTNGILWVIAEAFSIPTYKTPKLSIPSGTIGAMAGIIPTGASYMAWKEHGGIHYMDQEEQNMLAKIFGYDVGNTNEYPDFVWTFLNSTPPGDASGVSRREQIINRWVGTKCIRKLGDQRSREELDVLTGSCQSRHAISIGVLARRNEMLRQLGDEIFKLNRLLLELVMVLTGGKFIP